MPLKSTFRSTHTPAQLAMSFIVDLGVFIVFKFSHQKPKDNPRKFICFSFPLALSLPLVEAAVLDESGCDVGELVKVKALNIQRSHSTKLPHKPASSKKRSPPQPPSAALTRLPFSHGTQNLTPNRQIKLFHSLRSSHLGAEIVFPSLILCSRFLCFEAKFCSLSSTQ